MLDETERAARIGPMADAAIRVAGIAAIILAWLCLRALFAGSALSGEWTYAAAAAGFLGASAGSVLTVLGRHVSDRIAVSERWRVQPVRGGARTGRASS